MENKDFSKYIIDFSTIPYERKLEERALFPFRTLNFLTGGMELGEITIIAGETGCVDCDTEYFNGEKWVKIKDYNGTDKILQYNKDGTASLVRPLRYIKLPCNEMTHMYSQKGTDQCLSDDHIAITIDRNSVWHEIRFADLKEKLLKGYKDIYLPTNFQYGGCGINLTDAEIKVMLATICDGSFHNNTNYCRFNIKKDRKKNELRKIFKEANLNYKEKQKGNGYTLFTAYVPRREKVFGTDWYNCSQHQFQVICDNILQWDGHICKNGSMQFSANVKENIDFVQFAFASCNYRTHIRTYNRVGQLYKNGYKRKSVEYTLNISKRHNVLYPNIKDKNSGIDKYITLDGYKYCFTVPSGLFVSRRNGYISIIHNCGKSTLASQIVSEIIKHDKCFCIFGESTIEKQAHAQYRQMTPYNDNDYTFINYYKDGQKTNVGKFFVSESAEKKIKEMTAKRLFYYDPRGGMDIKSIMAVLEIAHTKGGINYFVIDNIMQIETTTNDEVKEMKDSFEQLRRFVIDNKVHCIVLAHYRKSNDYGVFRRRLEEIAGTSAIGNKCATALNIIRLDKVDRESKYSKAFAKLLEKNGYNFDDCDAVIEVLKTRHNKLGFVGIAYNRRTNTYYELKQINDNIEKEEKSNVVISQPELTPVDDIDDIFGQIGF